MRLAQRDLPTTHTTTHTTSVERAGRKIDTLCRWTSGRPGGQEEDGSPFRALQPSQALATRLRMYCGSSEGPVCSLVTAMESAVSIMGFHKAQTEVRQVYIQIQICAGVVTGRVSRSFQSAAATGQDPSAAEIAIVMHKKITLSSRAIRLTRSLFFPLALGRLDWT